MTMMPAPGFPPASEAAQTSAPTFAAPAEPDKGRPDEKRPLNRRQEKFCAHYALSGNAAEAARLAGYAEPSAKNHGFRLLRDARVADRVYAMRVGRAIKFGPVMAFTRLENLFFKASEAGDFRGAAHILTLQARLSGVESWMPPSAVVKERQMDQQRLGRGVFGPKGRDPFGNLDELCDIAYAPPAGEAAETTTNDDQ
jgi:hypothetical protein